MQGIFAATERWAKNLMRNSYTIAESMNQKNTLKNFKGTKKREETKNKRQDDGKEEIAPQIVIKKKNLNKINVDK